MPKQGNRRHLPSTPLPPLRPGVLVTPVADEALAWDPHSGRAHRLNPAGATVLRHCDGTSTADQAVRDLGSGHDLPPDAAREALGHHLSRLHRAGLLDPAAPAPERPSRRQFLARWGVAAAVLLPTMASLSAPAAANVQSCPGCINATAGGCQNFFGVVRLSICCACGAAGVCADPNAMCMTTYTKNGTSCLDDTVGSVGCASVNGVNVQRSCAAARAAVGNGAFYFCCECV